jgi:hypothetical protein
MIKIALCLFTFIFISIIFGTNCCYASDNKTKIYLYGTVSHKREFMIYNYHILKGGRLIRTSNCISAIFSVKSEEYYYKLKLRNKKVNLTGYIVDYVSLSIDNTMEATVSNLQNRCGNKYVLLVDSIKLR